METVDFTRFALAFLFILALIGAFAFVLRRSIGLKKAMGAKEGARLNVIETRYLDSRRRLVLVRRDEKEHLILLADGRETVIESNISSGDRQK